MKFKPALILILAALGVSLFWWVSNPTDDRSSVETPIKTGLTSELTQSKEAPTKTDLLPSEPLIQKDTKNWTEYSLVLKKLVKTHPMPHINRDFHRMVDSGEIMLNFQTDLAGQHSLATVVWIQIPEQGEVLVFNIDPLELVNPNISKALKQLVIFHEYIHIMQQKSGLWPKWLSMGYRVQADKPMDRRMLRILFESESEAYEQECLLAIKQGWVNELNLSVAYYKGGLSAMRLKLAEIYSNTPAYAINREALFEIARKKPGER